jgi:hypothetical protein
VIVTVRDLVADPLEAALRDLEWADRAKGEPPGDLDDVRMITVDPLARREIVGGMRDEADATRRGHTDPTSGPA